MENSFFEYRDKTGADSGSDAEIIDDSLVLQSVPFSVKKKNRTAFVAESDESNSNDDGTKEYITGENVSTARRSNAAGACVVSSSEDEDYSPELIPKRRAPPHQIPIKHNESLILQRTKKRMLFQDSDSDNSIIMAQKHNNKHKCLKDTPLKIAGKSTKSDIDNSMDYYESCDGDDDDDENDDDNEDSDNESGDGGDDDDASELHSSTDIKKKCKKLVISSDESSDDENGYASNKHTNTKTKKLVIDSDESSDEEIDDASNNHTNTETSSKSKKLVINSDESSDDGNNDATKNYSNSEARSKTKKLVINSDESSDDEIDDASNNHTNTDTSSKSKKLVINSDESSDDEIDDASNNHTNTEISSKSKKLVINSDEENEANEHQTNTDITKKCNKLLINSDGNDQDDIISKAVENIDISNDSHKSDHDYCSNNNTNQKTDDDVETDDDDGPDEDMMVMSRATRMSIMGVIPKDNDSDDSDFIQSDSSSRKTEESRAASLGDLEHSKSDYEPEKHKIPQKSFVEDFPEVTINQTQPISIKTNDKHKNMCVDSENEISIHSNDSRLSCSPFSSPLQDITNKSIEKTESRRKSKALNSKKTTAYMDLTVLPDMKPDIDTRVIDLSNEPNSARNKILDKSASLLTRQTIHNDDDVTIIDTKPEIIALSSDDEDEVKADKSSQKAKSPLLNANQIPNKESMKQYLAPSRAGQLVYVKKHVKENELNKLMRLKEDLTNVRVLLDEMDLDSLPDGGSRLLARHSALEGEVRRQGDKVANMVVEPDAPTAADIAKDGFDAGLSWDDIQKASNAVQPRMFGKQAMATHMAERNFIIERLRDLHASFGSRPDETTLAAAPRLLRSVLMPYQRHALAWLQWRETQKPAAGILADDMGLGKTITMISLIASDKQDKIDHEDDPAEGTARDKLVRGGTLVVCPASLIQQWASEVTKHCAPHAVSVCLHHGAARAAQPHRLAAHDMVATTYNILQRDSDKNGVLMRIQWRRIILDEAHIVRNHKSATSTAVSSLRGRRRWCLTGTPVQNKDLDLFALLKFLRLSPFDDLQMWKKWIDNKSQGGQERLNIIMQCILLRRTKVQLQANGQLACLPSRTAHTRLVTLSSDEMNVYQKVLVLSKTLFAQFLHQRAEKNSGATFTAPGKDSEYAKMHKRMIALQGVKPVKSHEILVLLLRLRQVCCHCGLIGSMLDEGASGAEPEQAGSDLLRELDKLSLEDSRRKSRNEVDGAEDVAVESAKADEAIRSVLAPNHPVFQLGRPSSKIAAVMDCLNENVFTTKGDKAVVVSQWTSVLNLVEQELSKKKIRSVTLSGAVPVPARPRLIDLVNDPKSDVRVMLLSLCAGGVGINLCGANHLLLLDPHWNPQLEEQAQDRIYRVGQNKPVHIYRFVCVDTVEQTIRKLQEAKLQLADNVLTGAGNAAGSPLSVEELKMMFNMGS